MGGVLLTHSNHLFSDRKQIEKMQRIPQERGEGSLMRLLLTHGCFLADDVLAEDVKEQKIRAEVEA